MVTEARAEAQRLVDEGRVNIVMRWYDASEAEVSEGQFIYVTYLYDDGRFQCTCKWGAVHNYTDVLCAHAWAVRLTVEKERAT